MKTETWELRLIVALVHSSPDQRSRRHHCRRGSVWRCGSPQLLGVLWPGQGTVVQLGKDEAGTAVPLTLTHEWKASSFRYATYLSWAQLPYNLTVAVPTCRRWNNGQQRTNCHNGRHGDATRKTVEKLAAKNARGKEQILLATHSYQILFRQKVTQQNVSP